jgi:acyl-CoA dehydrogenase
MVDFKLTDEQKQYLQLAKDFAQKEIAPNAAQLDSKGEFPLAILNKAWQIGLMNVLVPEQWGGLGLGAADACLISEELGAACTGVSMVMESNNLAAAPLIVAGNDAQKKEFLEPLTAELSFASFCATEPTGAGDPATVKTSARRVDDEYVVNGRKAWIANAGVARWYLLLASTSPDLGAQGLSAFLMPADADGISVGQREVTLGHRAGDSRALTFQDVKVPAKNLLGREGQGLEIYMLAADRTRPLFAAAATGLARSAMEHCIRYAKERVTFGQPIANHQAVSFMVADMAKDIEAARLLAWQAAWLGDRGKSNSKESLIAKSFAVDMAMRVATDAVQIYGGYGYSREYPVEKLMRDAKMLQIYEGTSQLQRVNIGKQLVGVGL